VLLGEHDLVAFCAWHEDRAHLISASLCKRCHDTASIMAIFEPIDSLHSVELLNLSATSLQAFGYWEYEVIKFLGKLRR
jgi:hypothetical protein